MILLFVQRVRLKRDDWSVITILCIMVLCTAIFALDKKQLIVFKMKNG